MSTHEKELFIDDCGRGPAVVLLHGTPSLPCDFQPLVDVLARCHRVLVPHSPGYGETPADAAPCSLDELIARLEDGITRAGISDAAVVGFSGGAYNAVAMALRGRVHVRALALLAPVLGLDPPVAQAYREMVAAVRAGVFDPRPTWLERMASPGFAMRDPVGARRVLSWLEAVPLSVVCDELAALADALDLRPRVCELTCPLRVVAGTADHAVPPDWSRAAAESSPRGSFVPIEGAGHALLVEAPDRVVRVIADFLGEG
jgi:pimeloyl-ACP methyl ester carboxylesterase